MFAEPSTAVLIAIMVVSLVLCMVAQIVFYKKIVPTLSDDLQAKWNKGVEIGSKFTVKGNWGKLILLGLIFSVPLVIVTLIFSKLFGVHTTYVYVGLIPVMMLIARVGSHFYLGHKAS